MHELTIENFWKTRITATTRLDLKPVKGWSYPTSGAPTFMEAPLRLNTDISAEADAHSSTILLVSAPGAVGKSTLAKQIAFVTSAVYVDLAEAEPVGGNTLSGGLLKSGIHNDWQKEDVTVLIDGLDEARFRVTQDAFDAFLSDIADLAVGRRVPIVLFGRTGAVQDSWLELAASGANPAILQIRYFNAETSVEFAFLKLKSDRPNAGYDSARRKAIELLLSGIRKQTESDGDRFAGYAPVLQAVAKQVGEERNPSAFVSAIEKGDRPITLKSVALNILERDKGKLEGLQFEDPTAKDKLYSPDEQLDRLVARIYSAPQPILPPMRAKDAETYTRALETWLPGHPFLESGTTSSSLVF